MGLTPPHCDALSPVSSAGVRGKARRGPSGGVCCSVFRDFAPLAFRSIFCSQSETFRQDAPRCGGGEAPPHGFTLQGALCAKHGAIALFPEPASYPRCSSFREMKLETFSPCYLISLPPVSSSRFLWSSLLLLEFSRLGSVNPGRTWKVPSVAGGSSASPGAWGNSSLRAGGLPGRRARTRWRSRARLRPQRPPRRLFISASSV